MDEVDLDRDNITEFLMGGWFNGSDETSVAYLGVFSRLNATSLNETQNITGPSGPELKGTAVRAFEHRYNGHNYIYVAYNYQVESIIPESSEIKRLIYNETSNSFSENTSYFIGNLTGILDMGLTDTDYDSLPEIAVIGIIKDLFVGINGSIWFFTVNNTTNNFTLADTVILRKDHWIGNVVVGNFSGEHNVVTWGAVDNISTIGFMFYNITSDKKLQNTYNLSLSRDIQPIDIIKGNFDNDSDTEIMALGGICHGTDCIGGAPDNVWYGFLTLVDFDNGIPYIKQTLNDIRATNNRTCVFHSLDIKDVDNDSIDEIFVGGLLTDGSLEGLSKLYVKYPDASFIKPVSKVYGLVNGTIVPHSVNIYRIYEYGTDYTSIYSLKLSDITGDGRKDAVLGLGSDTQFSYSIDSKVYPFSMPKIYLRPTGWHTNNSQNSDFIAWIGGKFDIMQRINLSNSPMFFSGIEYYNFSLLEESLKNLTWFYKQATYDEDIGTNNVGMWVNTSSSSNYAYIVKYFAPQEYNYFNYSIATYSRDPENTTTVSSIYSGFDPGYAIDLLYNGSAYCANISYVSSGLGINATFYIDYYGYLTDTFFINDTNSYYCMPETNGIYYTIRIDISLNKTIPGYDETDVYIGNRDYFGNMGYHEFANVSAKVVRAESRSKNVITAKLGYYVASDTSNCWNNLVGFLNGRIIDRINCGDVKNNTGGSSDRSTFSYREVDVPIEYLQETNEIYWTLLGDFILPEYHMPYDNSTIGVYNESFTVVNGVPSQTGGEYLVDLILGYPNDFFTYETLDLKVGWNMFSVPIELNNSSIRHVLHGIDGKYGKVLRYNKTAGLYETFNPSYPDFMNNFTDFETGYGYWISITENCTAEIEGLMNVTDRSINMSDGWNMFSWVSQDEPREVSHAIRSVSGNYGKVLTYDSFSGRYLTYNPLYPVWLNDFTTLEYGKSYWLSMTSNDTLEYNPIEKVWE